MSTSKTGKVRKISTLCRNKAHKRCPGTPTRGPFKGVPCQCVCHQVKRTGE